MNDKNNVSNNKKLKRELNLINVWAIAFGCIIGWGSFINPGKKFLPNSGVLGTGIAMLIGAIIMIIIAKSYAYMVPKYPKSGGEFTFTKVYFGKKLAYLCGWFLIAAYLTNIPMNSTAIGLIIDGLFGPILKFGFHYNIAGFDIYMGEMLFSIAIIVIFAILNIRGVKVAGIIQTILASLLAISVLILTIAAIFSNKTSIDNVSPIWGFDKKSAIEEYKENEEVSIDKYAYKDTNKIINSILATLAIAPWAFVGFDTIPQVAEESKFSHKKTYLIMIIAILFGCFVYIANNTITALTLNNWSELIVESKSTPWLLLTAAECLLGQFGKILVGVAVLSAVLSGTMGFYMAASRLIFSMAREGYLPKTFTKIHSSYSTPINAIIFCMIISIAGPILGREALGWFVDMSSIGASIAFGFTCLATLSKLKKENVDNKVLKFMAILGFVFSLIFIILQLIPIPGLDDVHFKLPSYIMLMIWIILGLLFYLIQRKSINSERNIAKYE